MTAIANEALKTTIGPDPAVSGELLRLLRTVLDDQRRALLQRAADFVDDVEDLQTATATRGQGESEHASSDVELGMTIALEANTLAAIEDIRYALARMDEGSYGICSDCGNPIHAERLMARPQARYCIACQERHEEGA